MKKLLNRPLQAAAMLCGVLLLASSPLLAETPFTGHQDTDLFMTNPNLGGKPNVLFIIDNSSNWSQTAQVAEPRFNLVKRALLEVIGDFEPDNYNIGIMLMDGSGDINGGFPYHAIQPLDETIQANLITRIEPWVTSGQTNMSGNNASFAGAMHEAFLYFQGLEHRSARLGNLSNREGVRDESAFTVNKKAFLEPVFDDSICADNYIIFIANGPPAQADTNAITPTSAPVQQLVKEYGFDNTIITLPNRDDINYERNMMDEYARFMAGQGIKTFTIDVQPGTTGSWPDHVQALRSAALHGEGDYYAVYDAQGLKDAIFAALDQIQAIDSVFAASSLPVSVNTRGTHLNEVYMAMFRPNETGRPQWAGNLKLYEFMLDDNNNLVMADALGNPAQNTQTGFLRSEAVSFWTYNSSYWEFEDNINDSPDGSLVERGGAAQQIRLKDYPAGRRMFTCVGNCGPDGTLQDFDTSNTLLDAATLGVGNNDVEDLINWVRGDNNDAWNIEGGAVMADKVRPYLHGDVVHSSPMVINYNRTGDDSDLVVYYGANDGQLRAVKGGKPPADTDLASADFGRELWSFIPSPFLSRLNPNWFIPAINTPSVPSSTMANFPYNKPYSFDGSISSYVLASNGSIDHEAGDKAWIFTTMRRGGRFMIAMDVSNPDDPRMMWQRGCVDGTCDPGYEHLGQTWSEPQVRRVRMAIDNGDQTEDRLVLIVGAGYDAEREDMYPQEPITQGQGILMIDAATGEVLWRAGPSSLGTDLPQDIPFTPVTGMDYSVPAPVVTLNREGVVHRMYVPDTGGNIWRVDLVNESNQLETNPGNWHVHKLAELGGNGVDVRKFLHRIDLVESSDSQGKFLAIVIGSGDREKPFEELVENRFYMIKDRAIAGQASGEAITEADLLDVTTTLEPDAEAIDEALGWYIRLRGGEKVVGRAESRTGIIFFGTNQPASMVVSDSCVSDLGVARSYQMHINDASPISDYVHRDRELGPNVGLPPPYIHVIVPVRNPNYDPDDPTSQEYILVEGVTSGADTQQLPLTGLNIRTRLFWNKEIDE